MDFLDLAKKRYSTRKYLPKPVSEADLALILEAGRVAPTAINSQPFRLLVLNQASELEKAAKGANVFGAPLVIIVCANHLESWKRSDDGKDTAEIDASIVTTHLMLEATELGLNSVWICKFDPVVIREVFHIPENIEPVNILAIGCEAGTPKPADRHGACRKPLSDLVVRGTF